ncbi:3,4-dihydroxy-2-butanone 4-phosphate synthase [candidate division MSBL1 archaeon SCGC-AAA261G05]|uniref:3,4-dihydroxy-2-butanone 4-phosphate synthase n=3 Tax=candidate division MSBL1 TaxID=215777 RepID=A0A133V0M3_9EURY|nr:3,4-dihydroxy-2-butanone 4-phosphate synthase [candidate division MSBL1 archaeon SCGC-AAA261C02]KXB04252.1 3,4-dihydroxy-2-butanone 4-phosphate synthase [candidate division MSBL1 archaeon SCGC-AAA261G05]KXB05116.1 3,4-dihydroxy-2-butanone 4-phosphate synthase [candidate division MSBL1 archaeon SCGC-AAA261O19]
MNLNQALDAIRKGEFVLISDSPDREGETDLVIAAEKVGPAHIAKMRRDGGGLICVALHPKIANNFGLPYMTKIYESASPTHEVLNATTPDDIPYDERSAFSITVNHRQTYTGVTDSDRALTIRELGKLGSGSFDGPAIKEFGREFRSPGHVPILRAAGELVAERQGHTELAVALMEMAGVTPVAVVCEMLDAETSEALAGNRVKTYAEDDDLVLLDGEEIVRAYSDWSEQDPQEGD